MKVCTKCKTKFSSGSRCSKCNSSSNVTSASSISNIGLYNLISDHSSSYDSGSSHCGSSHSHNHSHDSGGSSSSSDW